MSTKCANCPLRRKDIFAPMSADEVSFMDSFKIGELTVEAGTTVLLEGSSQMATVLVTAGGGNRLDQLRSVDGGP